MNKPVNSKCDLKYALLASFVLLTGLLLLDGCATPPPLQHQSPPPKENAVIIKPLKTNEPVNANAEFNQPEKAEMPREQIRLGFGVVDALIQSGKIEQAKQQANRIDPSTLSDQERNQLDLLHAQIRLSEGETELALENLERIQPQLLDQEQKVNYLQARAFASSLLGNFLDSAKARIELMPLLPTPESQDQNQLGILEALAMLNDTELEDSMENNPGNLAGWMALAKLYKLKAEPDFNAKLGQWRETFPDHPANLALLAPASPPSEHSSRYPGLIAVMLPETGPFAEAGKAVKAGIMAVFDNLPNTEGKPLLQFYDTAQAAPADIYHQAIAAGAKFVIGPLEKKDIRSLADSTLLEIPVLALNHIQDFERDNLYQFALSSQDDVRQIAEKARLDGHKKALLLLQENSQTQLISNYFEEYWSDGDRSLVKIQTYQAKTIDFSSIIRQLFNQDSSPSYDPNPLPSPETAETKVDADAIFISAYRNQAKAIKQQLNENANANLAVYALPGIYSGQVNPIEDQFLNGIVFCDMPWFFDASNQGSLAMTALATVWRQFPSSYLRLIAMGIDAFNLSARLIGPDNNPYPGATGTLSLVDGNRIKRDLLCAKFIEGRPQAAAFGDQSEPVETGAPTVIENPLENGTQLPESGSPDEAVY